MEPLVNLLVLTGFLSAVYCVLGIVAGLCEWVEQQFRLIVSSIQRQPLPPKHVRKLRVKNAGNRKAAKTASKSRGRGDVVRVVQGFGVHRKAA